MKHILAFLGFIRGCDRLLDEWDILIYVTTTKDIFFLYIAVEIVENLSQDRLTNV
ncbi:hypothetical protein [Cylindrospermum stagnale]|uniref:hypothetical protein n=1 Tax=Cylindrospermum stagnale TaxID=142864 RepID=UPI0002FB712B|nr:hypothetical protein [Cylindrospermum stagnale]